MVLIRRPIQNLSEKVNRKTKNVKIWEKNKKLQQNKYDKADKDNMHCRKNVKQISDLTKKILILRMEIIIMHLAEKKILDLNYKTKSQIETK